MPGPRIAPSSATKANIHTATSRDVPIPHFKPIPILLPITPFRADTDIDTADTDIDTADTTDTFLSIEHHQ